MQKVIYLICFILCFFSPLSSREILCLYKSSEGTTDKENEIRWHIHRDLLSLNYTVKYHDMDNGFPSDKTMKDMKAIVSWYRGASMINAKRYAYWLKDQLTQGMRVLVFGNYGAFQDRDSGEWMDNEILNVFFTPFGLEFKGNWTDRKSLIQLKNIHSLLTVNRNSFIFRNINNYLQFSSIEDENMDLATIQRTDIPDSESSVITITTHGAMALAPFICWQPTPKAPFKYSFERRRFLTTALHYRGNPKGKKILCLYKSGDGQTNSNNEIKWHLDNIMISKGYKPIYHDISRSLPKEIYMPRVVISWFRSPDLKNADTYLNWAGSLVAQQIKLIVLGNMGAFKERGTEEWLDMKKINYLFNSIGVNYAGQWTNNSKLIKYESHLPGVFNYSVEQELSKISHYTLYQSMHKDSTPYLTLSRSDIKDSQSHPIIVTPDGAFADGAYLFITKNKKYLPLLDLKKFVLHALP
ncbi:MAG: hypothetical protein HQL32_15140 [Planctomycetes bacterium]|nr:hypothetical protein [Planctomycetota bacterium]